MTAAWGPAGLERLAPEVLEVLHACGTFAAERDEEAYLVGGSVRDLALGRECEDIDVVIVGDGLAVAQAVARATGGQLTRYHAFQTARVDVPVAGRVDFATARAETYPKPGHLPQVARGTLGDDLARRDFTINTMALALGPDTWGRVEDPFDGRADLESGVIRFLHERSFADDPTRLLRALRFSNRLQYRIEARTAQAIEQAAQGRYLQEISGDRLRRELYKLLGERPLEGPESLQRFGLLPDIDADLHVDRASLRRLDAFLQEAPDMPAPMAAALEAVNHGALVLGVLCRDLQQAARWSLVRRLAMPKADREAVIGPGSAWDRARADLERAGERPSHIAACLDPMPVAALVVGWALEGADDRRRQLRAYLSRWRWLRPTFDGRDVSAAGVPEGEAVGRILERIRAAWLDGEITDRTSESALLARLARADLN